MIFERRLLTDSRGAGLVSKLWRVPWLFVLLLSGIAAIGYVAL
jgi:rod shape determining protein RodA